MLNNKSTIFATLVVFLGFTLRFASATPPACVLACVNDQPEVYNYEDICKINVADMATCLKSKCEDNYDAAVTNYKASCKEADFNVVIPTVTPTSSRASATSSATSTGTGTVTGTSTKTNTPTVSPTAGGNKNTTSNTDTQVQDENAAPTVYYNSMLALVAVFAAAAAL